MTDRWSDSIREKQHGFYRLGIWKFWNKFWWVLKLLRFQKLVPSSHQNYSHLWQTEALIFVTSHHIYHKICNCSQLSFVTIGYNSKNWSQLSVLITIFTIIKSHLSLVFYGKNCHKWSKLTNVQNFHNCSKFWQLTKLSNYSKLSQLVTFVKDKLVRIDFF